MAKRRRKKKKCYCGIGGQAVLEGVMMKNSDRYAVAVRKPDGTIQVKTEDYPGIWGAKKTAKIPFIRGVFNFLDSLVLGMKTLTWSAEFYEEEAPANGKEESTPGEKAPASEGETPVNEENASANVEKTSANEENASTTETAAEPEPGSTGDAGGAQGSEVDEAAQRAETQGKEVKSAEAQSTENQGGGKSDAGRQSGKAGEKLMMGATVVFSLVMAVAIFIVLPYFISTLFSSYIRNDSLLAILEGALRILIFLGYVIAISMMQDIRRVYMYHGAEHKCINCIERGRALTVKNVRRSSRLHRRCGTSFMLFVMFVSVILFMFIRVSNPILRLALRVALVPVIAGISYEILRLAGRNENLFVRIISAPGMWLQKLTTREPDDSMIEVAIASVEAVFDWKGYLKENFGYEDDEAL